MDNCNYDYASQYQDPTFKLFDPQEAGGMHRCDLTDPYQRAVAWELVELAWAEDGENWQDESIDGAAFELREPEPVRVPPLRAWPQLISRACGLSSSATTTRLPSVTTQRRRVLIELSAI